LPDTRKVSAKAKELVSMSYISKQQQHSLFQDLPSPKQLSAWDPSHHQEQQVSPLDMMSAEEGLTLQSSG
jgi:hypothetical protein